MPEISREKLLELLSAKGYKIIITSNGTSKYVLFTHVYSLEPYKLPTTFSESFTEQQIREYCVDKLLI